MTFFWPYVIIMFGFKYYRKPRVIINMILLLILFGCWIDVYFFSIFNGLNYLYQIAIGQLMGFFFLIAVLTFDVELQKYALTVGFNMRSSRAKKFYLLFFVMSVFIVMVMFYFSFRAYWSTPQDWILNANTFADEDCVEKF